MTLHEKLSAIQSELKVPKSQTNAFGKYKYRSCEDILESVKPYLKEHNLILLLADEMVGVGGRVYVKSTASISSGMLNGTGEKAVISVSAYARESETKKGMDDAQITGAASSYARKYALNGLFCIDDSKDADHFDNTAEPIAEASAGQLEKIEELAKDIGTDTKTVYKSMTKGKTPTPSQAVVIIETLEKKLKKQLDSITAKE